MNLGLVGPTVRKSDVSRVGSKPTECAANVILIESSVNVQPMKTSSGTPIYDKLLAADLLQLTRGDILLTPIEQSVGVELIAAADVLVYFGALKELLQSFADLSAPSSVLIFSCERISSEEAGPDGWKLRPPGRFAHSRKYVEAMAKAREAETEKLKQEHAQNVESATQTVTKMVTETVTTALQEEHEEKSLLPARRAPTVRSMAACGVVAAIFVAVGLLSREIPSWLRGGAPWHSHSNYNCTPPPAPSPTSVVDDR